MSSPRAIKGERDPRHKLSFGHPVIQEQSRASRSNLEETPARARWWAIHFTAMTRKARDRSKTDDFICIALIVAALRSSDATRVYLTCNWLRADT
jgi:hypothetical protein